MSEGEELEGVFEINGGYCRVVGGVCSLLFTSPLPQRTTAGIFQITTTLSPTTESQTGAP